MFGLRMFLIGALVGIGSGLFVANYHVVNSAQGIVIVPRTQRPPLRSSYVDIRSWSQSMWSNHPEVTQALIADGRSSLIRENLKANLLNEILPAGKLSDEIVPEQTRDDLPRGSRNVANQFEVPIQFESDVPNAGQLVTEQTSTTGTSARLLDSQSPVRKQFESAFDRAIAPMVEDDPADVVNDTLVNPSAEDAMVQKLEARFSDLVNQQLPTNAGSFSSRVQALPTSGDTEEMARNLLQQVIPQGTSFPQSATPLRDLGRDLLSAPAPGQGGASLAIPRAPTQSQLILSEPF